MTTTIRPHGLLRSMGRPGAGPDGNCVMVGVNRQTDWPDCRRFSRLALSVRPSSG